LRRASWERQRAEACLRLGQAAQSLEHASRALALLGSPVPRGKGAAAIALIGGLVRQSLHRLVPGRFVGKSRSPERSKELALANECFSQSCFFIGDMNIGLIGTLRHLNYAETIGPSPTLARAYGLASTSAGIVGLHGLARIYRARALATLETVHSPLDRGLLHVYFGLNEGASAHWTEMLQGVEEGILLAKQCGDRRRLSELLSLQSMAHFYSGAIQEAKTERKILYNSVAAEDDLQLRCWALIELAEVSLRQGDLERALFLEDAAGKLLGACGRTERVWLKGVRAQTLLEHEEPDRALAAANDALKDCAEGATQGFYALEGYAGAAQTCIELAAKRPRELDVKDSARRALKGLALFAMSFPMARPRAALLKGRYALLSKNIKGARRKFALALREAEARGMPYEEGLAHLELGLIARPEDRLEHFLSAIACFEPLGARLEVARVRKAIGQ
jgi:hypothetical protein